MILQVFSTLFITVLLRKTLVPKRKYFAPFNKIVSLKIQFINRESNKNQPQTKSPWLIYFIYQLLYRKFFFRIRSYLLHRSELLQQQELLLLLLLLPDLQIRFRYFCILSYLYQQGSVYRYIRFLSGRSVDRSYL